ncbi:MAG TPA: hypothetical protein VKZ49_14505 [Polyangiaceae bacterium]|nr:hypothetical protein [Polyangiaceae bacterium]
MKRLLRGACLPGLVLMSSCAGSAGSAAPAPAPVAAEPPPTVETESAPVEPEGSIEETDFDAIADAPSPGEAAEEDPTGAAPPDQAGRELRYVVTSKGLQIDVAGVRFLVNASPKRQGRGWGVRVTATAASKDGGDHVLLSPEAGPLAFAGTIEHKGERRRFGDERQGRAFSTITDGKPLELSRDFPGTTGQAPLTAGQSLSLEVGLWGLGDDETSQRPVQHFFELKMIVDRGGKPQPIVQPPAKFQ